MHVKRSTGPTAGFTLFEILVVILLIGITITLATLNLQRDVDQLAEHEARRFAALIEHVREEAVLTGRAIAVEIDETERAYRFLQAAEEWEPITQDDVLRRRQLPEPLVLALENVTAADNGNGELIVSRIIGDVTPFVLTIRGEQTAYRVTLDESQNITVTKTELRAG